MTVLSPARPESRPAARGVRIDERRVRGVVALLVLLAQVVGAVGLAWDIQWHISVGRDTFLTPPHILLYTSVTLIGLLCLALVLFDTWRARYGAGVDDANSVRVFGLFRAPVGFVLAGFGALTTALAAPLDNYWHELYGVDVALWAPFHTMGSLGGFIGLLGMLYAWSSLLASGPRPRSWRLRRPAWGVLGTLMLLVGTATVQARPALATSPMLTLGSVKIALYPVLLALFVPWLLVVARRVTGSVWAPLLTVGMWAAFTLSLSVVVPWLVEAGAAAEGLPLRGQGVGAGLALLTALLVVGLGLVGALATALLRGWSLGRALSRKTLLLGGAGLGLALWLLGSGLALFAARQIGLIGDLAVQISRTGASPLSLLLALPVSLAAAMASTALGLELSQVLGRSRR
ncbi:MAG: hypothetical protein U0893_10280 [Chloroflexota bacterium]